VLNYDYNDAHRDHFHIDDAQTVGFRANSRSLVLFVQGALTHIHRFPVAINGLWGEETSSGVRRVLSSIGIAGDFMATEVWHDFLVTGARIALDANIATDASPGRHAP
jgi:hypothetical protein